MRIALASLTAILCIVPSMAQDSMFRTHLNAPILFSGDAAEDGDGDGPTALSIVLRSIEAMPATVGEFFSYPLEHLATVSGGDGSIDAQDLQWSAVEEDDLPPGVEVHDRQLLGIPQASAGGKAYDFEIVASHGGIEGRQTYSIVVAGVELEIVSFSGGHSHTCAITSGSEVVCWGGNALGQLGDGTTTNSSRPVAVLGVGEEPRLTGVVELSSGKMSTCAISTQAGVVCWGSNSTGQLGDGTRTNRSRPVQVRGLEPAPLLVDAVDVATGESHACALLGSEEVACWGSNEKGQLGIQSTTIPALPALVRGVGSAAVLTGVKLLASGDMHNCAITESRTVCWGYNGDYGLGDGTYFDRNRPVEVVGVGSNAYLTGLKDIVLGRSHTCAITADSEVVCWGRDNEGQLGDGLSNARPRPAKVLGAGALPTLTGVRDMDAGERSNCAISSDQGLVCWGHNGSGQIGVDDASTQRRPIPVRGVGTDAVLSGVTSISIGSYHSCAIASASGPVCWGLNSSGQLGDGTLTSGNRPAAVLLD